jgi:dGTPase
LSPVGRNDRRHETPSGESARTPAQHDCDRVRYTAAFNRLGHVTQVVAPEEGHVLHNRLTHTLKVAQIARRLAEKLSRDQDHADRLGGIDPDVVETAALAHDIGHPPFGHAGEDTLDELALEHGAPDGFEGNAQSFRIVTRLAPHRAAYPGLNLTRASLNAMLKYPYRRDLAHPATKRYKKFGAYEVDAFDLGFARGGAPHDRRCVEAEIMDLSDDIAYCVHDLVDFFRAGLIPLEALARDEVEGPFKRLLDRWNPKDAQYDNVRHHEAALRRFLDVLPADRPYTGSYDETLLLYTATSTLIDGFVSAVSLARDDGAERLIVFDDEHRAQLDFLHRLVHDYVIESPRLVMQQKRQSERIKELFAIYYEAIEREHESVLPAAFRHELRALNRAAHGIVGEQMCRLTVDIIASLGDAQAVQLHERLTGTATRTTADLFTF